MSRSQAFRGVLLAGTAATLAACHSDSTLVNPAPSNPIFQSYVALGNSITAGFQSDGINDSTQHQSYAVLLAHQMGTRFAIPSLAMPGCRPPLNNFLTQSRVTLANQPASTALTCALRTPASTAASTINNVAVPGISSFDPTAAVGPNQTFLTDLILGGETMVQKALDNGPTFATVWVGNNDVLQPAITGIPATATPQATFAANYSKMITQLLQGASTLKGVLIGIVQVGNLPVMVDAKLLQNPAFVAGLSQAAGKTITVDPTSCTATTTALIGLPILTQIKSGAHPPIIACAKTPTPPIGDIFILDAAEQVQIQGIIDGYNTYIKAKADSIGFAYYDPNVTLAKLVGQGLITHIPNIASATVPFGQYFTLDGVHPSALAHITIVNEIITVINTKYGTNLFPIPTS